MGKKKETGSKQKLIHDLQLFLWQFEQAGYTREGMNETLHKLEGVLKEDAERVGEETEGHLFKMLRDCHSYVLGEKSPQLIVQDLNQLRMDLET